MKTDSVHLAAGEAGRTSVEAAPNAPSADGSDEEEVFMCGVDYQHHLHDDAWGTRVYASEEDLRARRKCVEQCGIVAVKVTLVRWVQDQNFEPEAQQSNTSGDDGSPDSFVRAK